MNFDLDPHRKEEVDRFSARYLPDAMNNNLGSNPQNLMGFDAQKDATLRADKFIRDNKLDQYGSSIASGQKWTGVFGPTREEGSRDYNFATIEQRSDIARYAMKEANSLQGERVMLQSMGIHAEDFKGPSGRYGYEHSFQHMLMDHPSLRPTDAEIARFEELTSFDKNGDNRSYSAEATKSRLHVPEQNREAFDQFRTEYLADRGLEYDPVTKTAEKEGTAAERRAEMTADRDAPSQTQSFSQGLGGMADSFVAEHDAQQSARPNPQFGAAAGRTMTQDGPDFG